MQPTTKWPKILYTSRVFLAAMSTSGNMGK